MDSNNVIVFPKFKLNTPPQSIEEIQDIIAEVREEHIDMIAHESINYLGYRYAEEGYNIFQDDCMHDIGLIVESIKSALLKTVGIEHSLQDFAQKAVDVVDSDKVVEEDNDNN